MKILGAVLCANFVLASCALENSAVGENSKSVLAADDVCLTQSGCALSALQTSGLSKEAFIKRVDATGAARATSAALNSSAATVYCSGANGCVNGCECGWTDQDEYCSSSDNDGSCCWACCCDSTGKTPLANYANWHEVENLQEVEALSVDIGNLTVDGSLNVYYNEYTDDQMRVTLEDNAGHGHHDFTLEFDNSDHDSNWSVSDLNTTFDTNHKWNMTNDASIDATGINGSDVHWQNGTEPNATPRGEHGPLPSPSGLPPSGVPSGLLQHLPYDGCREVLKMLEGLKDEGILGQEDYSDAVLRTTEKHCS
jgi:hypothetical protein